MSKKFVLLPVMVIAAACLVAVFAKDSPNNPASGKSGSTNEVTEEAKTELNKLASLGYLGGYRAPEKEDATASAKLDRMSPGLTLHTSGDSPAAYLLDSSGKVVHQWAASFESVFPELSKKLSKSSRVYTTYWRTATVLPGGALLAIFEGIGLVKLDRNSKVIWARDNHAHHDIQILPGDRMLLITRNKERVNDKSAFVDYISFCDSEGRELEKISLLEAVLQSNFKEMIFGKSELKGDIFHTNSVQVLDEADAAGLPGVRAGDLLISIRNLNVLAVINPETKKVVWAFKGGFKRQHYARLYDHRTLILFDNRGLGKRSQVIIFDWPSMAVRKSIKELPGGRKFFSNVMGLATILSNGNYLVVNSLSGRLYEISEDGELVWRYSNPRRTGDRNRLIATIPHAERIPSEKVRDWLPEASSGE